VRIVRSPLQDTVVSIYYSATDKAASIIRSHDSLPEIIINDGAHQIIAEVGGKSKRAYWGFQVDTLLAEDASNGLAERVYTEVFGSVIGKGSTEGFIDYSPFGEHIVDGENPNLWFGFKGRQFQPESGLYYNRARLYDPSSGRFTQPDPLGTLDGTNLYLYARNNPLLYTDPFGFESFKNGQGHLGTWPSDPDILSRELGITPIKDVISPTHGTRTVLWRSGLVEIRFESHATDIGPYNPRHHGPHYHVEMREPDQGWNKAVKLEPLGYVRGSGTGFLPGEEIPAAVYWGIGY